MPAWPMTMLPLMASVRRWPPNLAAQQVDGCLRYSGRGVNPVAKAACDPFLPWLVVRRTRGWFDDPLILVEAPKDPIFIGRHGELIKVHICNRKIILNAPRLRGNHAECTAGFVE